MRTLNACNAHSEMQPVFCTEKRISFAREKNVRTTGTARQVEHGLFQRLLARFTRVSLPRITNRRAKWNAPRRLNVRRHSRRGVCLKFSLPEQGIVEDRNARSNVEHRMSIIKFRGSWVHRSVGCETNRCNLQRDLTALTLESTASLYLLVQPLLTYFLCFSGPPRRAGKRGSRSF